MTNTSDFFQDSNAKLDAYGHLSFLVCDKDEALGSEGWMACFDAIRTSEGIAYHVVVDGGSFVDTLENNVVPATGEGISGLLCLPDYWHGIGLEHGLDMDDEQRVRCYDEWAAHLRSLLAMPAPEPDEEPADEMGELRRAALSRGQP